MFEKLKFIAKTIKVYTYQIYHIARDERTPIGIKFLAFTTAAYVLSPIDLIPDFIPIIGFLDEIIIVPIVISFIIKFTPPIVVKSALEKQNECALEPSMIAAIIFILIWCLFLYFIINTYFAKI